MDKRQAAWHLKAWTEQNIDTPDRARFRETAESELIGVHEGKYARFRIRPSEFAEWWKAWKQ